MEELILKWTVWQRGPWEDHLQVTLTLLDPDWEPLWESTKQCGPFHAANERRLELLDDARRWLRAVGYQPELAL